MARQVRDRADAVLALAGTFRRHGFEGASLSVIQAETGLGRGSLYHFFPAGKSDMAEAVLNDVQRWFNHEISGPLRSAGEPETLISKMFKNVEAYFRSRHFVCLFAVMTLSEERRMFAAASHDYFADWIDALTSALRRTGMSAEAAIQVAVDGIAGIQGILILANALNDQPLFETALARIHDRTIRAMHQ